MPQTKNKIHQRLLFFLSLMLAGLFVLEGSTPHSNANGVPVFDHSKNHAVDLDGYVLPGQSIEYIYTLINLGAVDRAGVTLSSTLETGISNPTNFNLFNCGDAPINSSTTNQITLSNLTVHHNNPFCTIIFNVTLDDPYNGNGVVNNQYTITSNVSGNQTHGPINANSLYVAGANCGNGTVNTGETCDDSNLISGDGCSPQCLTEECGNSIVDPGEDCDDGNTDGGDYCSATCTYEVCGNGVVEGNEECDDGNSWNSDSCLSNCTNAICGDQLINKNSETCDDGNLTGGDGCSATCQLEICGNGIEDPGEECDDGNQSDQDGCSAECVFEFAVCGNGNFETGGACNNNIPGLIHHIPANGTSEDIAGSASLTTNDLAFKKGVSSLGIKFDGAGDRIEIPMTGINTYSYSFWMKWGGDTGVSAQTLISQGVGGDNSCHQLNIDVNNSRLTFQGQAGTPQLNHFYNLTNEWTHVVVTNDENTNESKMYINGNLVSSDNAATCNQNFLNKISIGEAMYIPPTSDFHGILDEIEIYNRAITASEVSHIYNNTLNSCTQDMGEECDDGNRNTGDGCSDTCTIETDYVCLENPHTCICGMNGCPITITPGELNNTTFQIDYAGRYPTNQSHVINMTPANHNFRLLPGDDRFTINVSNSGQVTYNQEAWGNAISGHGTSHISVPGYPIDIDATSVHSTNWQIDYTGNGTSNTIKSVKLIPSNTIVFRTLSGDNRYTFEVKNDGTIDYSASLNGVFAGRGGTTLTILAKPIQVDATALDHYYHQIDYLGSYQPNQAHTHSLIPGRHTYRSLQGSHIFSFTVDANGNVDYSPAYDSFVSGRGTSNLTVNGLPITINGSNFPGNLFLEWKPFSSAGEVKTSNVMPGSHYLRSQTTGQQISFTVDNSGLVIVNPGTTLDGMTVYAVGDTIMFSS